MIAKALAQQGLVRKASSTVLPQLFEAAQKWAHHDFKDDRTFLESYRVVSWVYVAVSAIARNGAEIKCRLFRNNADGTETEIRDDRRLAVLNRPFPPFLSRFQLLEHTLASLHLTGKAFWEVQPSIQNPQFIFPIRSDLIRPIPDPRTYISGYEFRLKGRSIVIPPENVFYVRFVNPEDDYDGLSPMAAASLAATTDLNAVRMNIALLVNQARPAGVFTAPGELSDTAFGRLERQIYADYQGVLKTGKPLLLEAGLSYLPIGLPPKDMEYVAGRGFTRDEIYAIYRVPPTVAGVPSANYATARVEERRFWTQAVMPALVQICSALDAAFFPEEDLELRPDFSKVAALQDEESEKITRLNQEFDRGTISINEYRMERGRHPVEGGQFRYQPAMIAPVGTDEEIPPTRPAGPPALTPPSEEIVLDAIEKALVLAEHVINVEGTERRAALLKEKDQNRSAEEDAFARKLSAFFREQEQRVLANLRRCEREHHGACPPAEVVFDRQEEKNRMAEAGVGMFTGSYVGFRERASDLVTRMVGPQKISVGVGFALLDERAREFLREKAFKFSDQITETTADALRATIVEGFSAGESINQLQARVQEVFENTERASAPRALAIARTELTSIGGRGTMDGYMAAGAREHEWLSAGDALVRPSHQIDGETVMIGSRFSNGLVHPGDPSGPPGEIVNCRCDSLPVIKAVLKPEPAAEPMVGAVADAQPLGVREIGEFVRTRVPFDLNLETDLKRAAEDPRFREKVLVNEIASSVRGIGRLGTPGVGGAYDPESGSVRLNTEVIARSTFGGQPGEVQRVFAHEFQHAHAWKRKWFAGGREGVVVQSNPEATRLTELYMQAAERTAVALEKSKSVKARNLAKEMRLEMGREDFGRSYSTGLSGVAGLPGVWNKLESGKYVDFDAVGIARGYSLHSQHEFAATMFEEYVFESARLQQSNPDMFEFFESFYREGTFKELVEALRVAK